MIAFSAEMAAADRTIKAFLYKRMYEHWKLNRSHSKARRVVADLFQLLFSPLWLQRFQYGPAEWLWRWLTYGRAPPLRAKSDYAPV